MDSFNKVEWKWNWRSALRRRIHDNLNNLEDQVDAMVDAEEALLEFNTDTMAGVGDGDQQREELRKRSLNSLINNVTAMRIKITYTQQDIASNMFILTEAVREAKEKENRKNKMTKNSFKCNNVSI
jgi:hypothetical protein